MIGPAIPEGLLKKKQNESEIVISFSDEEEEEQAVGPQIPAHVLEKKRQQQQEEPTVARPQIPQHLQKDIGPQIPEQQAGPQIPQHILEQKRSVNVGPQIPDHILQQKRAANNADEIAISDEEDEEEEENSYSVGPQIPQHILEQKRSVNVGPQIPDHILQQKRAANNADEIAISDDEEEQNSNTAGPQIPQHILEKMNSTPAVEEEEDMADPDDFAPALPPDLLEQRQKQRRQPSGRRRRPVGASFLTGPMPPQEDDEYMVGPALPKDYNPEEEAKYSVIHAIEERARQAKEAMEKKEEDSRKVERPEWMLVPPEVDYLKKANSSKSRQFTNKTMSKSELDSSEWTETPAQKQQRLEEQRSGKRKIIEEEINYSALDMEKRRNVQEYNMQTRSLSLLELHQQKKKKSKEPTVEDVTKRAFDREKDLLGGKKLDRKSKQEFLKQSAQFGQKFGYGSKSFL